jgi:hypothetical protein
MLKLLKDRVEEIDNDRLSASIDNDVSFKSAKEAMLLMHCEWQSLVTAIRLKDIDNQASKTALRLAAAALKFAADLGDPRVFKLGPDCVVKRVVKAEPLSLAKTEDCQEESWTR